MIQHRSLIQGHFQPFTVSSFAPLALPAINLSLWF